MNTLKTCCLFLLTVLVSCSANSIDAKNNSISSSPTSVSPTLNASVSEDELFVKSVREDTINDYKKEFKDKAFLNINLESQLKYIDDADFIKAGKLSCKTLDNITPDEDKFNPRTMRGVAKESKHPGVYTKIRKYLDPELKFNSKDVDYMSLNDIQQLAFLGIVPHLIANNVLNNSIKYYCPQKN
jgi:hypothetical protein